MDNKNGITLQTRSQYQNIIKKLEKWAMIEPRLLSQAQVDLFIKSMATDYSPQTINFYRAAINDYYKALEQPPIRLKYHSVGQQSKRPERILDRFEVGLLIKDLHPFYSEITQIIYTQHKKAKLVLAKTPSRGLKGGNVTIKTLRYHFKLVSKDWDKGHATPQALFVSGIIHALQDGKGLRDVGRQSGLKNSTMEKYEKLAHK